MAAKHRIQWVQLIKVCSAVCAMLLCSVFAAAQSVEPINTDRPDQSDGTYVLERAHLQLEEGLIVANSTFLNDLMLRYGITNSTEIRLGISAGKSDGLSGLLPVTFSAKQRLLRQHAALPDVTLVGYLGIDKLATRNFSGSGFPAEVKLAFENEISQHFSVSYNLGTSSWFENLIFTLNFSYSPGEKLSFFAEYFSDFRQGAIPQQNADAGFLFLINPRCQLDLAASHSFFSEAARLYGTFGISYRFN